jgi:hypothetical protein
MPRRSDFAAASKAIYLSTKFGAVKEADIPPGGMWPLQRMSIASETGWTLEYVDNMSEAEIVTYLGLQHGESKAQG